MAALKAKLEKVLAEGRHSKEQMAIAAKTLLLEKNKDLTPEKEGGA